MTNRELRAKYGDFTKTDMFKYPDHFFSPWDDFTMHIQNWKSFLTRFESQKDLNFLELGTAQGRATVWLLENILTESHCKITTVDINNLIPVTNEKLKTKLDEQNITINCLENLDPYIQNNTCKFVMLTTNEFFKNNIDQFDFVYIDASHDPVDVLHDAINSFDVLKPHGLMLFDDYGWGECHRGIEAFLHAFHNKISVLHKEYQVLIEKK